MKITALFENLPISNYLENIHHQCQKNSAVVLQAEPGAGKSTAVPMYLLQHLDLQGKKIIMLEPRRLAAISLAQFLAAALQEKVGETVGYQIKNERKVSKNTRLEIVTEGILTARIQQDPELTGVGLVIFDEFHERSLHADLGISLCKEIMQVYNESLKVLVMSATIDSQQLSQFLEQAPIIQCPGRCYPVSVSYLKQAITSMQVRDWLPVMRQLITQATKQTTGDILVFLPGQGEIQRLLEDLKPYIDEHLQVTVPLFGQLKSQQQQAALQVDKNGRQKIILATNIAETSLTLPNITAVVDSGLVRTSLYDVSSGMNRLQTQRISKASAEQRMGRAGRLQAGHCYRLWTESQQLGMPDYLPESILQKDLTVLRLSLAQWGVKQSNEIEWLTPPPQAHFAAATDLLTKLNLLDESAFLTELGKQATNLNLEPRLARCLLAVKNSENQTAFSPNSKEASDLKALACDLVAVLSEAHFYHAHHDADLSQRIAALQAYRKNQNKALQLFPVKASVIKQAANSSLSYRKKLNLEDNADYVLNDMQNELGVLLCWAYPDRIAKRRQAINKQPNHEAVFYLMSNGKSAALPTENHLKASEWLVIAGLDGQRQDGQIYLAAPISEHSLSIHPGFKTEARYRFNAQKNKLEGVEETRLGAIVVKQSPLTQPNKQAMQNCLFAAIKETRLQLLPWNKKIIAWLNKVRWLKQVAPQQTDSWPDFSEQGLLDTIDEWLLPYLSQTHQVSDLASLDLTSLLKNRLDYALQQEVILQAPQEYQAPSGKWVKIEYSSGQLPKVALPLQEIFGELTTPTLAWGQVNLSFELLSPARRPIQTTSDLAGFWQSSYVEIAKEMRGRYPKHRWPEEPLLEKPGRSIKRKV